MNKEVYDKALTTIPAGEVGHFQKWYVTEQDSIDWEVYKSKGYRNVIKVKKIVEHHALKITGKPKQLNLARTSPFFPMSRRDMQKQPIFNEVVMESGFFVRDPQSVVDLFW